MRVNRAIETASFFENQALIGAFRAREGARRQRPPARASSPTAASTRTSTTCGRCSSSPGARAWPSARTSHAFTDGRDVSPTSARARPRRARRRGRADRHGRRAATTRWTATSAGSAPSARSRRSSAARASRRDRSRRRDRGHATRAASPTSSSSRSSCPPPRLAAGRRRDPLQLPPRPGAPALASSCSSAGIDLTTMTRYRDDFDCPGRLRGAGRRRRRSPRCSPSTALRQLHVAETEKYAHVTYFFNGGREEEWAGETRILVPSPRDVATYDQKPEMSAAEVAERFAAEIPNGYRFAIVNFANPDMVGHTGVDPGGRRGGGGGRRRLGRTVAAVEALGGVCLVTADHGNAEQLLEADGVSPHTAHTTNPVPLVITLPRRRCLRRAGRLPISSRRVWGCWEFPPRQGMTGRNLVRSGLTVGAILRSPRGPGHTACLFLNPTLLLRASAEGGRTRLSGDPRDVRGAGLQLRAADGRRPGARRGPDAGHLPPHLPGAARLLAALPLHDLALPDREEPRARRAARPRAQAAGGRDARRRCRRSRSWTPRPSAPR